MTFRSNLCWISALFFCCSALADEQASKVSASAEIAEYTLLPHQLRDLLSVFQQWGLRDHDQQNSLNKLLQSTVVARREIATLLPALVDALEEHKKSIEQAEYQEARTLLLEYQKLFPHQRSLVTSGNLAATLHATIGGDLGVHGSGSFDQNVTIQGDLHIAGQITGTSFGASTFHTDAGNAVSSGGIVNIVGGPGINTAGANSTVTINLTTPVAIAQGGTNATSMVNTDGVVYYDGTKLNTTAVGTAGAILTSQGPGNPPIFQTGGATTITITGDVGSASSGGFTFTGGGPSGSGALFTVSGTTVTESFNFLALSATAASHGFFSAGFVSIGGAPVLSEGVGDSTTILVGAGAGNANFTTAYRTTAVGALALSTLANTATDNTVVGYNAGAAVTTGNSNIVIGSGANVTNNSDSNNIVIGTNSIAPAGSNQIKIGFNTAHPSAACFIDGISGKSVSASSAVLINSSGQLGTQTSSRRYKKNIEDLHALRDNFMALHPVSFNYISDASETLHYGLIAEEVEPLFPNLIMYNKEGLVETVQYHMLPALFIKMIQDQQRDLEAYEQKLERQERLIVDLHQRLEILERRERA